MSLLATLDGFFADRAPIQPGDGIVVAFSGGPDSSALLGALARWRRGRRLALTAAHLDHGLDPGSAARARAAAGIARVLGVSLVTARCAVPALRRDGESLEAAARRLRYRFLETVRREHGARYVATAHHRDDQAETLALRLLQGTGLGGLAGISPRREALIRPLLSVGRAQLATWNELQGIEPVDDPTNRDPRRPRNLVRHHVLPALEKTSFQTGARLARLAAAAAAARSAVDRQLLTALAPSGEAGGIAIERRRLELLPAPLLQPALALLHRLAGAEHPPTVGGRSELARQLERGGKVGCHTGGGWLLASSDDRILLRRSTPSATAPFAYTLDVPGEVELPAGIGALRLSRQPVESWMFRPSSWRAGLSLALDAGDRITVRSRRPGDRIRPFGCSYHRRLKDVLIDRKVPRRERDRLPLLCVGSRVVWVPGVTVAEECRLPPGGRAWVAEWERP